MKYLNLSFLSLSAFALILCTSSAALHAADLTIQIEDVKSATGTLMVALYNSPETFLKKPLTGVAVKAKQDSNTVVIKDLPAGEYAFAVYHDVNQNAKMDTNVLGIPTEDYGFSNNALGKMGPPSFVAAKFAVPESGMTTSLSLR